MADTTALEMQEISKRFGGVQALCAVNMNAYRGKVNVLMGENGAGKSTLMRVLAGAIQKDAGTILVNGQKVHIECPEDALKNGISMIYQELNLVPTMTAEQNMSLGKENVRRLGFVRKKESIRKAQALLDKYQLNISATAEVKTLSIAQQQMLEIAKAIASNARIIVMDEPTSSLTTREVENLFRIIRRLKEMDKTIIYISHRMEEVFSIGDHVTVMRDGALVGEWPIKDVDTQKLIGHMVGRTISNMFPKETVPIGETILEVRALTKNGVYKDVSFSVRRGEILGLSGLVGAGRTEVCMSIFGALPYDAGEIYLNGKCVKIDSPQKAIGMKIAYIPEDRKKLALDLRAKISDNIALVNLDLLCNAVGFVNKDREKQMCLEQKKRFRIKTPSLALPANSLSGGNQQKVVLAKWLVRDVDVLILDEPTRGIDVGSKEEIHRLIVELAREGKAIIMVSSELPEVMGMSDRILTMYEGSVTGIIDAKGVNQESIMAYLVGASTKGEGKTHA